MFVNLCKGRSKAVAVKAQMGPEGLRSLRLTEFAENQHMNKVRLVLRAGRLYPRKFPGTRFS